MVSSTFNKTARDLAQALKNISGQNTTPYDTQAEVRRIEGSTAWVHIPGGIDETPVQLTTNAKKGDIVQVRVSGGNAWLYGNATSPPTDDTKAKEASKKAEVADEHAVNAVTSAMLAQQFADTAKEEAENASSAAIRAWNYADDANTAATNAWNRAGDAASAAAIADGKAVQAGTAASNAQTSANAAKTAANNALTQLSIVEDVAGTLNWIQEHGSYVATSDTTVQDGKVYFEYSGGDYVPIVSPDPEADPSSEGWYELSISDSQSDYIMAHIAVTSSGLWVLPSGMASGTTPASGESQDDSDARQSLNYKALLSSSGLKIYDGSGNIVSTFGQSIIFSDNRQQVIGGQNNYILFDPSDGSITINGSNVKIGNTGKVLSDVLTDIDVSVEQTSGGADITINGDTVHIYDGATGATGADGEDGTVLKIDSSRGVVFKNNEISTTLSVVIYRGSNRITNITDLHSTFGSTSYLQWSWQGYDSSTWHTISNDDPRLGNDGFTLTLTPQDVDIKIVFSCNLII